MESTLCLGLFQRHIKKTRRHTFFRLEYFPISKFFRKFGEKKKA